MSIRAQANRIGTDRSGDVLEGLLAEISELDRDLAANLIVSGRSDADATRLRDTLKPRSYVHAIAKNVLSFDQDVPKVDPDPKEHTPVLWDTFVPFGHHRLHRHGALDRIDHRGKLKEHTVPRVSPRGRR
jgi:hypothetical protein